MIESLVKCERQSRSRQRFFQRPHTPVHQHQLEQIKTQYLSHQHDTTIDRDTVLKINRLATRRNLHKREHSWPPTQMTTAETVTTTITASNEHLKNFDENEKAVKRQQQQQHIRSTSHDNALQFDETICKRHGIDVIREKFNSPSRIIEPTAQEVRQRREKQRKLQQHQQIKQQQQQKQQLQQSNGNFVNVCEGDGVLKNKPKQMINLLKHEKLLRKNPLNKSATITDTTNVQKTNDNGGQQTTAKSTKMKCDKNPSALNLDEEDKLFKSTTVPAAKGFFHPETVAADEGIGLVEPKRQFYEHLNTSKKWHSFENINATATAKPSAKPLLPQMHNRQAYSLERGREARQHRQLPPQKPRSSPRLQRRSMKLATEIKISYDADAQQHNIQVKSLNQPKKNQLKEQNPITTTTTLDDLEHIPLPATPTNVHTVPVNVEQICEQQHDFAKDTKTNPLKDQQIYDDSCIYLRSIDLQDNTVAYIPAAITIVPSPTEEIMQNWIESSNLKANIKGVNDIETTQNTTTNASYKLQDKNENLISILKHESIESAATPRDIKSEQMQKQKQNDKKHTEVEIKTDTDTYVTRLPNTSNGMHITRQANVNTKRKTQIHNSNDKHNNDTTTLASTTEATTAHKSQQTRSPGAIHANETSAVCNREGAKEGDKTQQQQDIYYTVGEFVYGPCDPYNGSPLATATVHSLQTEQNKKEQLQQQLKLHRHSQIKKDTEAETESQHKNEIANLTAKYEHIQKSINEHLRQIDTYIENAKAALKSTVSSENNVESFSSTAIQADLQQPLQHNQTQNNLRAQQQAKETPLKEILRNITNIMQEVKPLYQSQNDQQDICMQEHSAVATNIITQGKDGEENMPIVDKVLMDLNVLTKHLSSELEPIIEQHQQTTALDLPFEIRPTAATASNILITEEEINKENGPKVSCKSVTEKSTTITPAQPTPPPPPPPLPTLVTTSTVSLLKPKQEKRREHIGYEQFLTTDKLITTQTQSQQSEQQEKNEMTKSAVIPKGKSDSVAALDVAAIASKDKIKSLVFNFSTARHEQEKLVDQIIDKLGKFENESKENLVNIHVHAYDEQIKSNLNQQTLPPSAKASLPSSTATNIKAKDMAIMQNGNTSILANAFGKDACKHGNDLTSTKKNESQLKLHIKDIADEVADKQFKKYDNQLMKNLNDADNDVVNGSSNNKEKSGKSQLITHEHTRLTTPQVDENNKIKMNKKPEFEQQQLEEQEGDSHHSSGSELSNTYKSSYELPSPYVTMHQISWEDVLAAATPTPTSLEETQKQSEKAITTPILTTSAKITKPKHDIQISQICTKSPVTSYEIEPTFAKLATPLTASGHVEMQSTTTSKPRIQTSNQQQEQIVCPHHQQHDQSADDIRKYPALLIEPHLPTRSTSPFGLNAIEMPLKHQLPSVSPTHLRKIEIAQDVLAGATRKYPSPLVEPHLPTRATSPFALNEVEMKNVKRSPSTSPKRTKNLLRTSPKTVDEMAIRKYPAPLAEPHIPTRAASPFGLNPVDILNKTRATTPSTVYGAEVKSENEQEQEHCCDKHEETPTSPTRKYPPALIEPHVPTRACSPFGLNAVEETRKQAHRRTPSPARGYHPHQATTLKSYSTTSSDGCKKTVVYVPQVEGHNIGLLVRTSAPTPHLHHTDAAHALSSHREMNATKTPHDYVTMTATNIAGNKYCVMNDIGRDSTNDDDNDDDDETACDELQRINAIGSTKQGTTAASKTEAHHQHQLQKQEHQHQHYDPEHTHQQHQEQQQQEYTSGSGQHMILLPTSAMNRSFDNVSPRPYISIEGTFSNSC